MELEPLPAGDSDPTPIFELFRGAYATELLTAAVARFDLFGALQGQALSLEELGAALGLARRPIIVLTTALRAMGLLAADAAGRLRLAPLAERHLAPGAPYSVADYICLAGDSPGVREMAARLRSNRPAGAEGGSSSPGTAFIYRAGVPSAMEQAELARFFTLALAGRANNVAPVFAQRAPLENARLLLDVGGGTGIYSVACLRRFPRLRATVLDRPEVLKIAAEFAAAHGVADRLELLPGDMFGAEALPRADAVLLSNILHDWDEPQCADLVARCAAGLPRGGAVLIHDVFLDDALDGPLPIALYSAALFTLTEGRAYSAAEYRGWLRAAGLTPGVVAPTLVHCGVLAGVKE